jgi:hypothetical protein
MRRNNECPVFENITELLAVADKVVATVSKSVPHLDKKKLKSVVIIHLLKTSRIRTTDVKNIP